MPANHDIRHVIARASQIGELEEATALLRRRYEHLTAAGGTPWKGDTEGPLSRLPMSPLLCQPHEREPIEQHLKKMQVGMGKGRVLGPCVTW